MDETQGVALIGKYNNHNVSYRFTIGNGTDSLNRKNIFGVSGGGNVYATSYNTGGADYAEYFEWD
jgi:hypothetical protein